MTSVGRFAAAIGKRSIRIRPSSSPSAFCSNHKSVPAFSSSTSQFPAAAFRFAPMLGSLTTMLPLHTTIAAARLKSNIAVDTRCWSWLSQVWNSSVNNDPDNIASINLGLVGLTFLLQLLIQDSK